MSIGHRENGLPIGVQIIGGLLDDNTTIAFPGLVEREFGGPRRPRGSKQRHPLQRRLEPGQPHR
jgi:Asp-tRNA(Asn)/Glu-tRNA(Gln) amidotransferase A subunit family amidase